MEIGLIFNILSKLLRETANKIDAGNSNLSEKEAIELVSTISQVTNREAAISKYAACKYLGISRATFDKYAREGKLPKGKHRIGFKELSYTKKELDEYVRLLREK